MRKKRVGVISNYCKKNTGFAKAKRNVLKYLYSTDKYELIELANGYSISDKNFSSVPWDCVGTLPDNPAEIQALNQNPQAAQLAGYGHNTIDRLVKEKGLDCLICVEDIWGFKFFESKSWWNQITPIVWTTLDSLPILDEAYDLAEATENFFVWAEFAEKEMKQKGYPNVKTLHGPIDLESFYPLGDKDRQELRRKHNIDDYYIVGFVFRNQLRKSVPNLLQGFVQFKKKNPSLKTKLLLHTSWTEGWDIPKLASEHGVDMQDILTTYVCSTCGEYVITHYQGEQCGCPHCKSMTLNTTNINVGVDEKQLNEIYNLMDVYCHPFTSGGQEIPIQEAKLAGLITLVTSYSCGEEYCTEQSGGLPLAWSEYREPGSQFIKASTDPKSIAYSLDKVFNMSDSKRKQIGATARQWVLDNFDVAKVCGEFEKIIDAAPFVEQIKQEVKRKRDLEYNPNPNAPNEDWADDVLRNILKRNFGHKHREGAKILEALKLGKPREVILANIRRMANAENEQMKTKVSFESLLDANPKGRVAVVMPRSVGDVFLVTSLLPSIKGRYPDKDLYFITDPHNFELLAGNPYVHKLLPYFPEIDNSLFLEGQGAHQGYFDVCYRMGAMTQNDNLYSHNGMDIKDIEL